MPEAEVRSRIDHVDDAEDAAQNLAYTFRVSTLAAGVRLRHLGLIDEDDLTGIWKKSDEAWVRAREAQKDSDGFVPPWRLRYRDLGTPYIGTVAEAMEQGRVDMMDATYLLNARVPMVEQLLEEYYRNGGRE
jgi:Zn-dependent peptidase ImmA (M78 family)